MPFRLEGELGVPVQQNKQSKFRLVLSSVRRISDHHLVLGTDSRKKADTSLVPEVRRLMRRVAG